MPPNGADNFVAVDEGEVETREEGDTELEVYVSLGGHGV
jgi:hypothetical protein